MRLLISPIKRAVSYFLNMNTFMYTVGDWEENLRGCLPTFIFWSRKLEYVNLELRFLWLDISKSKPVSYVVKTGNDSGSSCSFSVLHMWDAKNTVRYDLVETLKFYGGCQVWNTKIYGFVTVFILYFFFTRFFGKTEKIQNFFRKWC